jgi:anthranilate phosphoribosyltransferase
MQTPTADFTDTLFLYPMIIEALHKLVNHEASLTREEARGVMGEILKGGATDAQVAALAVALHMKGETVEEIVGFAEAIRSAATPLALGIRPETSDAREALVDTCGTGGDVSGTFNISTVTALVVAGAGVRVAKHGNRSATSQCGSVDVLEALGVNIAMSADRMEDCLRETGIVFLFAQAMHPAMKYAQPARRQLRLQTVFNLLGPLTNPAGASAQVVGVYAESLVEKLAAALRMLGVARALVVHGSDGLDEITITDETKVADARPHQLLVYKISPEQFGMKRAPLKEILGGDVQVNTEIARAILKSEKSPRRDVVLLNAAAALMAAGKAETINDALPLAARSLDSGAAREKLEKLVSFTNRS